MGKTFLFILMLMLISLAPTAAQSEVLSTWVVMQGIIEYYGDSAAYGWCGAYAETGEWAEVMMAWTFTNESQLLEEYNFYAGKLVNTTIVETEYAGTDFYIEGLWDIYNVTFTYDLINEPGNYTFTMELLVDDGLGTLSVTNNWTDFTVNVQGIELIRGSVVFYAESAIEIPIGDVFGEGQLPDGEINIWDLVHIAKAYGSTPGNQFMPNYDFSLDFNFDFIIDIYDLTTIAVNIGKSY